jgi:transposase-like protein
LDEEGRWPPPGWTSPSFVGKLLEQDDVDALREGVRVLAQAVMESEVSGQIGAAPYERSSERVAYRNGYRTRRWDTRVGTIELKITKVTAGAYFPSLLEPAGEPRRPCTPSWSRPT